MNSPLANKNSVTPEDVLGSAEFKMLIAARQKLSFPIVGIIIVAYFGFILMIAFNPAALGHTIGGGKVSIGIYLGIGLLILSFVLTAVYLRLSNGRIAELQQKIRDKFTS